MGRDSESPDDLRTLRTERTYRKTTAGRRQAFARQGVVLGSRLFRASGTRLRGSLSVLLDASLSASMKGVDVPDKHRPGYYREYYRRNRRAILDRQKQYAKEKRPYLLASKRKYRATPKGKAVLVCDLENRRAKRHGVSGRVTADEWLAILEASGYKCWVCGKELNGRVHMDHIMPLSRGGPHVPENVRPACPSCNCSKGNGKRGEA